MTQLLAHNKYHDYFPDIPTIDLLRRKPIKYLIWIIDDKKLPYMSIVNGNEVNNLIIIIDVDNCDRDQVFYNVDRFAKLKDINHDIFIVNEFNKIDHIAKYVNSYVKINSKPKESKSINFDDSQISLGVLGVIFIILMYDSFLRIYAPYIY